jgi:hypothetical protein
LTGEGRLDKRQFPADDYPGVRKARKALVDASKNDLYAKR